MPIVAVVKSVVFQAGVIHDHVWVTTAVIPILIMRTTRRGSGARCGWLAVVRMSGIVLVAILAVVVALVKGLVVSLDALVHNLGIQAIHSNVLAITAVIAVAVGTTRVRAGVRMGWYLAVVGIAGGRDFAISAVLRPAVRDHLVVTVLAVVQGVLVEMGGNPVGIAAVPAGAVGTRGVRIRTIGDHAVVGLVDCRDVAFPAVLGAVVLLVEVAVFAIVQSVLVEVRHSVVMTAVPAVAIGTVRRRSPQLALSIGTGTGIGATTQLLVLVLLGGSGRSGSGKEGRVAQDETEGNEHFILSEILKGKLQSKINNIVYNCKQIRLSTATSRRGGCDQRFLVSQ